LKNEDQVNWLDLCCGEGKALIQTHKIFTQKGLIKKITLEGIDLVDMFDHGINDIDVDIRIESLLDWKPSKKYNLITCVHGLHYLGDKLGLIKKIVRTLKVNGLFIGNIDLENIKNEENNSLKKTINSQFKKHGIIYNAQKRMILCRSFKEVVFDFEYVGANDKAGPNYTGQPVVDSFYTPIN